MPALWCLKKSRNCVPLSQQQKLGIYSQNASVGVVGFNAICQGTQEMGEHTHLFIRLIGRQTSDLGRACGTSMSLWTGSSPSWQPSRSTWRTLTWTVTHEQGNLCRIQVSRGKVPEFGHTGSNKRKSLTLPISSLLQGGRRKGERETAPGFPSCAAQC